MVTVSLAFITNIVLDIQNICNKTVIKQLLLTCPNVNVNHADRGNDSTGRM